MTSEPPFRVGDKVRTDFYKRDSLLIRVVEAVYRKHPSDSGWFVATQDQYGREMAVDAKWYELVERKEGQK